MGYIFKGTLWKGHKEFGQQGEGSRESREGRWASLVLARAPAMYLKVPFFCSFICLGGHRRLDYVVEDAHPRQWAQIGAWLAGDMGLMLHLECQGPETNGPTYSSQGVCFPSAECRDEGTRGQPDQWHRLFHYPGADRVSRHTGTDRLPRLQGSL